MFKWKLACNCAQRAYSQWLKTKEIKRSFGRWMYKQIGVHPCEGEKNMPPQNILWHKDYFEFINLKNSRYRRTFTNQVRVALLWGSGPARRARAQSQDDLACEGPLGPEPEHLWPWLSCNLWFGAIFFWQVHKKQVDLEFASLSQVKNVAKTFSSFDGKQLQE